MKTQKNTQKRETIQQRNTPLAIYMFSITTIVITYAIFLAQTQL
ncbi:hypothetical protein [Patiriisocius marinistellae]|nr:hypothetical protein [Patiriisocius marinistellae]